MSKILDKIQSVYRRINPEEEPIYTMKERIKVGGATLIQSDLPPMEHRPIVFADEYHRVQREKNRISREKKRQLSKVQSLQS